MYPHEKLHFFLNFFHFINPLPLKTHFSEEDLKSNDMKITLEIATRSNLRMQSDPKTGLVSFSCKNFGKNCFEIFAFKKNNKYILETEYTAHSHRRNCELKNQDFEYLKIYNLMKLKKSLIESVMLKHNLFNSSPSEILAKMSNENEYFFEKNINYNIEMRRKLRKRFDNIINIDIKKITKGGRDDGWEAEELQEVKHQVFEPSELQKPQEPHVLKQTKQTQNLLKFQESESEFNETSFFQTYQSIKVNKSKTLKKKDKSKSKKKSKSKSKSKSKAISRVKKQSKENKENEYEIFEEVDFKRSLPKIYNEIYENPGSFCELREIKELNQEFSGYDDIFAWSFENREQEAQNLERSQQLETETINDKVREGLIMSLRNSLMRRPLEGQSLQHLSFPQNFGFQNQDSLGDIV